MPTAELLKSTAEIFSDYRAGEIPKPNAAHVERWLQQFDAIVRDPLLKEINHNLKKTYLSRKTVEGFLSELVDNAKFVGSDAKTFWKGTMILQIQRHGGSQKELVKIFEGFLKSKVGLTLDDCGKGKSETFVYIDDGIFTGMTIIQDLKEWIKIAPPTATVHIVVVALHNGGQYYAETQLAPAVKASGKKITFKWWRVAEIEDRRAYVENSDVLRPKVVPAEAAAYAAALKFPPVLRHGNGLGGIGVFASADGRNLVEQQLLIKGIQIREQSPLLGKFMRPLGNMVLDTLGFGSMFVTFRNCPNNAPLALWAGNPWYPLFPRKTN